MSFTELCTRIMNSSPAYPDEQIRGNIETEINKLKAEHTAENSKGAEAARLDLKYRLKLGYLVLNIAGKRGTRTLLS